MINSLHDLNDSAIYWRTPTPVDCEAGTHVDISDITTSLYITEAELSDIYNQLQFDAWSLGSEATIILDDKQLYELESGLIIAERVEYSALGNQFPTAQGAIDWCRQHTRATHREIVIETQWEVFLTVDLSHIHHAA